MTAPLALAPVPVEDLIECVMTPRARLFRALIKASPEPVPNADLKQAAWPGLRFVSDQAFWQSVYALRRKVRPLGYTIDRSEAGAYRLRRSQ